MTVLSAAGASSLSSVVNSSSVKSSRQAALSGGWVRMASSEYSMGTLGVDGDEFFGEQDVVAVVLRAIRGRSCA